MMHPSGMRLTKFRFTIEPKISVRDVKIGGNVRLRTKGSMLTI